eukprot:2649713-Rhodomonas_salina.1
MSGTVVQTPLAAYGMSGTEVQYGRALPAYAQATGCPVLTSGGGTRLYRGDRASGAAARRCA